MAQGVALPAKTDEQIARRLVIQRRLQIAGWIAIAALVIFIFVQMNRAVIVSHEGDTTRYATGIRPDIATFLIAVAMACRSASWLMDEGITRPLGVMLAAATVVVVVMGIRLDISNHHITVTPTSFENELGTVSDPVRHHVDFTTTAYMTIEPYEDDGRTKYALVAYDNETGDETRVPINTMMREAIGQIMENAAAAGVFVDEDAFTVLPSEWLENL